MGDSIPNVEEILYGSVDVAGDSRGAAGSAGPEVTHGRDIEASDSRVSSSDDVDRIGSHFTVTPVQAAWPIYSKERNSVLENRDAPLCKSVMFDVSSTGADLSRGYVTYMSESVPKTKSLVVGFLFWGALPGSRLTRELLDRAEVQEGRASYSLLQ